MGGVELMIPSIGFGHPFSILSIDLRGGKVAMEDWGEFSVQLYLNME
jgi:hypothetical protein